MKNHFDGRIGRKNYLVGQILLFIVFWLIFLIGELVPILVDSNILNIISFIYIFIYIYFSLVLTIRRLHDFNKNGWWSLLVSVFGIFSLIFLSIKEGNKTTNKYGKVDLKTNIIDIIFNRN